MSTAPTLTYHELKELDPCEDDFCKVTRRLGGPRKWNGHKIDANAAREAGCTFNQIAWAASAVSRTNPDVERRLRLWMADCAARVLHIYEKTEDSKAPREAIIAVRQFARGEIDDAAWDAARAAARDAARAAARDAARDAAWAAARDAAWAAAKDAAWAAARDAEEEWQFDRLIQWLSDDEPEDWPLDYAIQQEAA